MECAFSDGAVIRQNIKTFLRAQQAYIKVSIYLYDILYNVCSRVLKLYVWV